MYTEQQLTEQLKKMGIRSTDTLIVHTSLKSVGKIDDCEKSGADILLSALRACVADGLLLVPAFTFANIRQEPVFNVRTTMPCIGAVPCTAVKYANEAYDNGDRTVIRSLHPSHSVVAFGKTAQEHIKDDEKASTPTPMFGSIGKLLQNDAKILLIGLGVMSTTFIHAVDEHLEPDGISAPYPITFTDYEGNVTKRFACNCQGPSGMYHVYEPYLEKSNALTYGKLGDAECRIILTQKCFEVVSATRETVFKPACLAASKG